MVDGGGQHDGVNPLELRMLLCVKADFAGVAKGQVAEGVSDELTSEAARCRPISALTQRSFFANMSNCVLARAPKSVSTAGVNAGVLNMADGRDSNRGFPARTKTRMARQLNKLTARKVQTETAPGRHSDGGGLYLVVDKNGAKRWAFIYRRQKDGKQSEMGLGGLISVPLGRARELAAEARALLASGRDPVQERKSVATAAVRFLPSARWLKPSSPRSSAGWRNDTHRDQWRATIATYCAPIAAKPINAITTEDVLTVLRPIWADKNETASRLRGRIEKVLDAAKAKGYRSGENPARWRGHLDHLLPRRQKLQRGHHPALPYQELPHFMTRLREQKSVAALALEFCILTAGRSGEVLGAQLGRNRLRPTSAGPSLPHA